MPVVLREKGYQFGFFGADQSEPPHVHVKHGGCEAKFWMEPFVRVTRHKGFRPHDLKEIENHRDALLEAWLEYFNQ